MQEECHRQAKIVLSTRNRPIHNARNMSRKKALGECLLKVKGVNLQRKNDTRLSNDESRYEGLYNELKASKPTSGS